MFYCVDLNVFSTHSGLAFSVVFGTVWTALLQTPLSWRWASSLKSSLLVATWTCPSHSIHERPNSTMKNWSFASTSAPSKWLRSWAKAQRLR